MSDKSKGIKVYIASSYTIGDVAVNVKTSIDCASDLIDKGYIPFAPLLSHFIHLLHPKGYSVWTDYDLVWVKVCNVVLRLPGESKGADKEVELARSLHIPIVYSISDLDEGGWVYAT